jgi:hypothetical protein
MRYLRPGAYLERADAPDARRALLRSDIAAFVGIAETGPLDTPVAVQSFRQFQSLFGGFIGGAYLAYAVRGFFENGGRRCWVVRVASRLDGWGAESAAVTLANADGPLWRIRAVGPGSLGNGLAIRLSSEEYPRTAIDTAASTPLASVVASVAGFDRGSLVRITQETGAGVVEEQFRVVSAVEATTGRLWWRHSEPGGQLPYDRALAPLDANRPASVTGLTWRLSVYRDGRLVAGYGGLGLVPEHRSYGPQRLAEPVWPTRIGADADTAVPVPPPVVIEELRTDLTRLPLPFTFGPFVELTLTGGRDGLTRLAATDFIGEEPAVDDSDAVRAAKVRGIEALNLVDEITLVAVPDILIQPLADPPFEPEPLPVPNPCLDCPTPPDPQRPPQGFRSPGELPPVFDDAEVYRVQAALIAHCAGRGDRFAVLAPPYSAARDDAEGLAAVLAWRARFDSDYGALYYPWLMVPEPRGGTPVRAVPPCGHVLGQYAWFDNSVGVHRSPGNRALAWALDLTVPVSIGAQEVLNPVGIDALRIDGPRGLRPMGVRTLSSDPDWRYVSVRRLLSMIRKALFLLSEWVVFEPNNADTRNRLRVLIDGYLNALFRRGAFAGASAEEAYFVRCDESTTTAADRDEGRLIALVGVAASRPFEFVVVRVGVQANALEVDEAPALARVA